MPDCDGVGTSEISWDKFYRTEEAFFVDNTRQKTRFAPDFVDCFLRLERGNSSSEKESPLLSSSLALAFAEGIGLKVISGSILMRFEGWIVDSGASLLVAYPIVPFDSSWIL